MNRLKFFFLLLEEASFHVPIFPHCLLSLSEPLPACLPSVLKLFLEYCEDCESNVTDI
jgi:hypothetical protein